MKADQMCLNMKQEERDEVASLLEEELGLAPVGVERYSTGLCHRVYCVTLADGAKRVLRVTDPGVAEYHYGCRYLLPRLAELGVPTQTILHYGQKGKVLYMLLSWLPGNDLGQVYHALDQAAKKKLAYLRSNGAVFIEENRSWNNTFVLAKIINAPSTQSIIRTAATCALRVILNRRKCLPAFLKR